MASPTFSAATATAERPAAHCPTCGYKTKVLRGGLIASHRARRVGANGPYMAENCDGTGHQPWYPEGGDI